MWDCSITNGSLTPWRCGGTFGGMRAQRIENISRLPSTKLPIESDGNFLPLVMVFVGPKAPHIIRLLLQKHSNSEIGHYDICTSYAGFIERSYFCDQCNKGFDHNDFRHHPCEGQRCHACKQVECGAKPDYALREVPCYSLLLKVLQSDMLWHA